MCNCIDLANKRLAEMNTQLVIPLTVNMKTGALTVSNRPLVKTEKVDTKKRVGPSSLFCSYCPFCGKKIVEKK